MLTTCSKDRGPPAEGDVRYPQNGASVTAAPAIVIQKYTLHTDLLLHSIILRARCWLASWSSCGTAAILIRTQWRVACVTPMSHTPAVRSS